MKEFPVETNPFKLVEYCCGSNIYKEGEDVKLKPESEYPDWLWTLNTGIRLSIKLNSVVQILFSLTYFIIYGDISNSFVHSQYLTVLWLQF